MADETLDRVIWGDAHMSGGQQTATEINHAPLVVRTAGTIIQDDTEGITIAAEDIPDETPVNYRATTFIPRSLVIEVERYRKIKPRKLRVTKVQPESLGEEAVTP